MDSKLVKISVQTDDIEEFRDGKIMYINKEDNTLIDEHGNVTPIGRRDVVPDATSDTHSDPHSLYA